MEFEDEQGLLEELLALTRTDALWDSSPFFSSTNLSCIDESIFDQQFYSSPNQSSSFNISELQDFVPVTEEKNESDLFTFAACTTSVTGCEKKVSYKKKSGDVPSKNLMAERRRRKRLNDRLSMLRSVVPKISKMDRTSILADTIDYMKELLERIKNLQEEMDVDSDQTTNILGIFKDINPSEIFVRNSPKFEVERRNGGETRIEVSCATKPGLLMSTISTLEAMGLDIQQCVVSCFNDFGMQASCSGDLEKKVNSEEIKQALFRNAGYGGRCL